MLVRRFVTNSQYRILTYMIEVSCQTCTAPFLVKPSWVKNGYGKFCSPTCRRSAQRTGTVVLCHVCQKETYKPGKALKGTKSGLLFCGKSCQTKWRNNFFSKEKHPNYINGDHSYKNVLLKTGVIQVCRLCKTDDVRVLAVHHVDHNHFNNKVENLAWLCHNCHHLVHHHKKEHERFMATIV